MTACPLCSAPSRPMPRHPEAELFRCTGCSHAFTYPESIRSPEEYGSSYFEQDHQRWFEHPNLPLFERILTLIPLGASLLDVGCGRGDLLRFARTERPDLHLTGIDLAPNSGEGIVFLQGDILTLEIAQRFDAVVSLAVIEHVAEVRQFVARMRQLTRSRGMLITMTLNDGSLLYAAARAGRAVGVPLAFNRLYSAHHLHHFTRPSLAALLERNGCTVEEHWDHNAPIEAMDLPVNSATLHRLLRIGLRGLWIAGAASRRSYLQTIICQA